MKKVSFMLFVLLLLSGNMFSQIQLVTATKAYILDRCQGDANVLKTVKANSTVMFLKLSDCSDLFYKVEYNGVEGFLHQKAIKPNSELAEHIAAINLERKQQNEINVQKEVFDKRQRQIDRKAELYNKYGHFATYILEKQVKVGMTEEMVIESIGGTSNRNVTETTYGTSEQWVYGEFPDNMYIYFENGKVTAIQR